MIEVKDERYFVKEDIEKMKVKHVESILRKSYQKEKENYLTLNN